MSARVSVIVPTYNRAELIGETLECLLRQTLPPHEVLVVDDGSTDDTVAVVRGFGERVTLIQQANAGPGAARNAGLAKATGEFIQFFDSDDLATHDKLQLQARSLIESGADISYCAWTRAWFEGNRVRLSPLVFQQGDLPVEPLSAFLRRWIMFMPASLVRRSLLIKVGGYPTAARTGEDLELLLRLILTGARFVHTPGPLLLVRQHPEGQLSAAAELEPMRARDRVWLISRADAMLADSGVPIGWRERLSWHADRWSAQRDLARLDADAALVTKSRIYAMILRGRQIMASLRTRWGQAREGALYRTGPLTAAQRAGVLALGYEPL